MCCSAQQMDQQDRNQAIAKIMLVMSRLGRTKTCWGLDVCLFSHIHTIVLKHMKYTGSENILIWWYKNSFSLCLSALNIIHLDPISEFKVFFSDTKFRLCSASSATFSNSHTHIKSRPQLRQPISLQSNLLPFPMMLPIGTTERKSDFFPHRACAVVLIWKIISESCSDPESLFQALWLMRHTLSHYWTQITTY